MNEKNISIRCEWRGWPLSLGQMMVLFALAASLFLTNLFHGETVKGWPFPAVQFHSTVSTHLDGVKIFGMILYVNNLIKNIFACATILIGMAFCFQLCEFLKSSATQEVQIGLRQRRLVVTVWFSTLFILLNILPSPMPDEDIDVRMYGWPCPVYCDYPKFLNSGDPRREVSFERLGHFSLIYERNAINWDFLIVNTICFLVLSLLFIKSIDYAVLKTIVRHLSDAGGLPKS